MVWYGKCFLEASVGATIRRLCHDNVSIEVDPLRNAKGPKDVERNVDLLVYWCREIWEQIYAYCSNSVLSKFHSRSLHIASQSVSEMRQLFEYIRQLVEERYPNGHGTDTKNDLPRQSVSAFFFCSVCCPSAIPSSASLWPMLWYVF